MRKDNMMALLDYLWDLKEENANVLINLREWEINTNDPIDIFIMTEDGTHRFYIIVSDEEDEYEVRVDQYDDETMDLSDIKLRIEEVL